MDFRIVSLTDIRSKLIRLEAILPFKPGLAEIIFPNAKNYHFLVYSGRYSSRDKHHQIMKTCFAKGEMPDILFYHLLVSATQLAVGYHLFPSPLLLPVDQFLRLI